MTVRALQTAIGEVAVTERGTGETVVFVHGNLSDADVWQEQLRLLPDGFRGVALDLRGYGRSPARPVDATRGVDDFVDDVEATVEALLLPPAHLVGHSLGAGVVLGYALRHPDRVRSLALVAPMSPFGFGASGPDGTPTTPDGAGSGGGAANPDFVRLLSEGDRGDRDPASPRNVIRTLFFPSPEAVRDEDAILESMLRAVVDDDHYPGDQVATGRWPGVAPGTRGVLNAISPVHLDLSPVADDGPVVPVLHARGAHDVVISDASLLDFGNLGKLGAVPGWPGEELAPPQPMVAQLRAVLERLKARGARVHEEVFDDAGHFLFTQEPKRFAEVLARHLAEAS